MVLDAGGLRAVAALILATRHERVRLRALVVLRRMLYEAGSTGRMDANAIQVCAPLWGWGAWGCLRVP